MAERMENGVWRERVIGGVKRKPLIDRLIQRGDYSLEQLGEEDGTCRENIRQYILNSGQYELWKQKREEIKKAPKDLCQVLLNVCAQKSHEEGFAIEKAFEYYLDCNKDPRIDVERVIRILQYYEDAREKGETSSYKKIGESVGNASASYVQRVLSKLGLKSLNWSRVYY